MKSLLEYLQRRFDKQKREINEENKKMGSRKRQ